MEIEIGRGKKARRAYGFDEIAVVPSRRTRDPDDIDISWNLGPYRFELPLLASAMDGVVSPHTAALTNQLGGLGVLNLEGIWSRYEDADTQLERIAKAPPDRATQLMQEIYAEPVKPELIAQRITEIKDAGAVACGSLTPQKVMDYYEVALEAGIDILVIQGTVISAEHVSRTSEPLNLKEFIAEVPVPCIVGGCASYSTGLHLMRTGAVGVLVGVGPGAACTTRGVLGIGVPQATAIADVAAARSQHMLETGTYCNVIADGGMRTGGDVSKAIACGGDAVMIGSPMARANEAPGRGYHWGMATFHPSLPRGTRVSTAQDGSLEQILLGPANENDGTFNLMGALRTSMATCGYEDIPSFHRAEIMVAPALQTEGKKLQSEQSVGMGSNGRSAVAAASASPMASGGASAAPSQTAEEDLGAVVPGTEEVLVLDFGGQYSQLIARRIRECGVFAELLPATVPIERIRARKPRALVLSGGPASVYEPGAPAMPTELFDLEVPMLGICYGMQVMMAALDGKVEGAERGEFGRTELTLTNDGGRLLAGLPETQQCWMSHRDSVFEPPPGFRALASSPGSPVAACEHPDRGLYGIQFHPEVVHTPHGTAILERFLRDVAGCTEQWTMSSVIETQLERVREQVGDGGVICGLSGGVDSATAAALVHRAVGSQLTCVLVDHGLLRKGEAEQVVANFREGLGIKLIHVDARERFLARLAGVDDPETKRKIIGEEFIRVFEEEARKLSDARFLVQGTLYSDVIESGGDGDGAAIIKSHHNVGGLPDDLDLDLVEPLRMLFKDEVRKVAAELGLSERMVWRQPFPGPGLAIRIVGGEVTPDRLETLREADAILQEEVRSAGLYRELWQSFCVLPVVRSVGVQGDGRTYAYPIIIRAVTSDDAMTADWARLPYDLLERASNRIINEIPQVNRVALDISSKPPATIEWE